jgi:hypothetical protein
VAAPTTRCLFSGKIQPINHSPRIYSGKEPNPLLLLQEFKKRWPPHLFKVIVPAHSFKPLNAGNPAGFYIRFSFFGNIGRDELKNQLSVEVIAGTSASSGVTLSVADPTVFFRHADMVEADINPPHNPIPIPDDPILNMFQE